MNRIGILILLIVLAFACSGENQKARANLSFNSPKYTLELIHYIGGEDRYFGNLKRLVADSSGRVFVYDLFEFGVTAFNDDRKLITKVGKRGRGPSEITKVSDFAINPDYLFILDKNLLKLNVYDLRDFDFQKSIRLEHMSNSTEIPSYPDKLLGLSGDKVLVIYKVPFSGGTGNIERNKDIYLLDLNSENLTYLDIPVREDDYYVEDRGSAITVADLPYMRKSFLRADDKNNIVVSWSDSMKFRVYNSKEELTDTREFDYQKRPVNINKIIEDKKYEYLEASQINAIEDTWPAFENYFITGNRIILVTNISAKNNYKRAVISHPVSEAGDSEILCILPRDLEVLEIKDGGHLYGLEEHPNGQRVAVYRMVDTIEK